MSKASSAMKEPDKRGSSLGSVVERVRLSEIISRLDAGVSVNAEDRPVVDGEHGVLKVSAVTVGHFNPDENKVVVSADLSRVGISPQRGDLLVTRANTRLLVAAAAYVHRDYPQLHLSDKIWKVVVRDPRRDDARWLKHVLSAAPVRAALIARASGTSGSMKNVSQHDFLGITVDRLSADHQRAVANILDMWDRSIACVRQLIKARRKLKRGLLQQLLTGERRFHEFRTEPWRERRIGEFLTESRVVGTNGANAQKLSIRLYGKGVYTRTDNRIGSAETQYYRRCAGQLVYSKLDFLNGAFGIVPPALDGFESTLDVPAFDIGSNVDPRWVLYFLTREGFYSRQLGIAHGGRKARRVNPDDFLGLKIKMPDKPEQTRIADVLAACDRELEQRRSLHDTLREQRKGLMQMLLTGKCRVPASLVKEAAHA